MKYKEALTQAMTELGRDPAVCFVGYGVREGGQAAGTLRGVSRAQLIETPVAENLMAGVAIGLALQGRRPVLWIERMDFILNALDAIVNHLDKIPRLSGGQFHPAVMIRCLVGGTQKPLFTGPTHTQDFTKALRGIVSFPVIQASPYRPEYGPLEVWREAHARALGSQTAPPAPTMLIEYKDLYDMEVAE